ncbi:hypothetical protein ABPG72_017200 [Tetrahymena utriculariae]
MEIAQNIDNLLNQVKALDLFQLREYSSNRNTTNICYVDSLFNIQSQQKADEIKQLYSILNQQYSYQLAVRGDGNCFYRAMILMKIFYLASSNDSLLLENFISYISDLKDIQMDVCAAQVVQGSGLLLIFRLFLMKILSWKKQQINVDSLMIINEYNSLPEVDFAACSIARCMVYLSFQKYKNHPQIKAFVDDQVQQDIYKNILKQNEYAEGIIIPLAAQSFQCQLVIQNINCEQGSALKINKENIIYKPMVLQQPDICQIHLLFSKDHYDLLFLNKQCEQFPLFYKISSTKFNSVLQNINYYQNFLLHQKFYLKDFSNSQIQKNNQQSQVEQQQSKNKNDFVSFRSFSSQRETPTSNPRSQIQNAQKQNQNFLIKQDQSSKMNNLENSNINKEINIQNNLQINQQNSNNPFLSNQSTTNKNNVESNHENQNLESQKCASCKKKIYSFSEFYQIQQIQSKILEKICKACNQRVIQKEQEGKNILFINQKQYIYLNVDYNSEDQKSQTNYQNTAQIKHQQFFRNKSLQLGSQNLSNSIPLKQTQSEIQNQWDSQLNFDFQNFDMDIKIQKEDICLYNSAFMINQPKQQNSNINSTLNKNNFPSIQLPQKIKKNQVTPIIFQESNYKHEQFIQEEGDKIKKASQSNSTQYFTATLKSVGEAELGNVSQKYNNQNVQEYANKQQENQKNDKYKCIKCKGPFKSQKYILKGKKIALLCAECLEELLKDLKKDQNSITIDDQTYKFGDSIISKIKEQKLIEKQIKKNNIINPSEQVLNDPKNYDTEKTQKNQKQQFCSIFQCCLCNKDQYSTYEICEILKGGKEKIQRVCTSCVHIFVTYYQHPSQLVSFDNKTYKINEFFSKYIYNLQLIQVQAEAQVQQYIENREVKQKQKCIVCNSFCKQRYPVFNINDPQTQLLLGHFCFYYNLHCIKDNIYFIFQGNTYILGDQLKKYAFEHILVQIDLYNNLSK